MDKSKNIKVKFRPSKSGNMNVKWIISIFFITLIIASIVSNVALAFMGVVNLATAIVILLTIVFIGICFDVLGIAVAAADETPFHSMSASKVPAAKETIFLIRKASIVSNICNDVIGDICGIISGAAASAIVVMIIHNFGLSTTRDTVLSIVLSSIVAALTVGGKALGKEIALRKPNQIVYLLGKIMHLWRSILPKKRKK